MTQGICINTIDVLQPFKHRIFKEKKTVFSCFKFIMKWSYQLLNYWVKTTTPCRLGGGNYKGKFTDEERVIQNTWTRIFFQPQKNFEKVSESKASLKLDVGIPKKYLWWTQLESDVFLKAQKKLKEKNFKVMKFSKLNVSLNHPKKPKKAVKSLKSGIHKPLWCITVFTGLCLDNKDNL